MSNASLVCVRIAGARTADASGDLEPVSRLFEYDAAGNLTEKTDRNGRAVTFDYDNLHRMTAETWLGTLASDVASIGYEFDEWSRLIRAEELRSDDSSMFANLFDYDDLDRVYRAESAFGGSSVTEIHNIFDAAGRRTDRDVYAPFDGTWDGHTDFAYDDADRLTQATQYDVAGGNVVADKRADFSYYNDGRFDEVKRYGDVGGNTLVATSAYAYDDAGRLTGLLHEDGAATPVTIVDYTWTRDALGRVKTQAVADPTDTLFESLEYTYDPSGQLTEVDDKLATTLNQSFAFDPLGNRTETETAGVTNDDYETDAYNRLADDGTWTYEYDDEGNMTSKTDGTTTWTYTWDHRNRLVESVETTGGTSNAYENRYDAFDRQTSAIIDNGNDGSIDAGNTFLYDGNQIVLTLNGVTVTVTNRYLWGPGEGMLLCDEQVTSLSIAGTRYWPLADHKGTVRDILDDTSTIVTHYDYSAFGAITGRYDADSQNPIDVAFRYNGQHYNENTGQINAWHRWYDPEIGRWLSEDWIRDDHQNTYRYVRNDPVNYIDANGLEIVGSADGIMVDPGFGDTNSSGSAGAGLSGGLDLTEPSGNLLGPNSGGGLTAPLIENRGFLPPGALEEGIDFSSESQERLRQEAYDLLRNAEQVARELNQLKKERDRLERIDLKAEDERLKRYPRLKAALNSGDCLAPGVVKSQVRILEAEGLVPRVRMRIAGSCPFCETDVA